MTEKKKLNTRKLQYTFSYKYKLFACVGILLLLLSILFVKKKKCKQILKIKQKCVTCMCILHLYRKKNSEKQHTISNQYLWKIEKKEIIIKRVSIMKVNNNNWKRIIITKQPHYYFPVLILLTCTMASCFCSFCMK